jgi:hypothetical protein
MEGTVRPTTGPMSMDSVRFGVSHPRRDGSIAPEALPGPSLPGLLRANSTAGPSTSRARSASVARARS